MTVKELREALAAFPDDAPVVCQGTSVAVRPTGVAALADIRREPDSYDLWPFEQDNERSVVILTD